MSNRVVETKHEKCYPEKFWTIHLIHFEDSSWELFVWSSEQCITLSCIPDTKWTGFNIPNIRWCLVQWGDRRIDFLLRKYWYYESELMLMMTESRVYYMKCALFSFQMHHKIWCPATTASYIGNRVFDLNCNRLTYLYGLFDLLTYLILIREMDWWTKLITITWNKKIISKAVNIPSNTGNVTWSTPMGLTDDWSTKYQKMYNVFIKLALMTTHFVVGQFGLWSFCERRKRKMTIHYPQRSVWHHIFFCSCYSLKMPLSQKDETS